MEKRIKKDVCEVNIMKIEKIDIDNISYHDYRRWLQKVSATKAKMLDKQNKRLQLTKTIRKQREILKTLYKEESDLVTEIETIKENLIEVIPSKF